MLYPVYLHLGDETHAHGMTFPDFPGCFAAADSLDDVAKAAQEAVEVFCEGEDMDIPQPSSLEVLARSKDYADGTWMLVDIDTAKLDTKAERINITVRARDLAKIDAYVARTGGNRSAFMVGAALEKIRELRITSNPVVERIQREATSSAVAVVGSSIVGPYSNVISFTSNSSSTKGYQGVPRDVDEAVI